MKGFLQIHKVNTRYRYALYRSTANFTVFYKGVLYEIYRQLKDNFNWNKKTPSFISFTLTSHDSDYNGYFILALKALFFTLHSDHEILNIT